MQQFAFPTTIYFGVDALDGLSQSIQEKRHNKALLVTDPTLRSLGIVDQVCESLRSSGVDIIVFDEVHPNPIEEDIEKGAKAFLDHQCDAIIGLGGGSPLDVAKVIKIATTHPGPLSRYDDMIGGEKQIVNEMPPLYAISTTSGTGSEVGRSGVIIMRETQKKTIFFSPRLMPDIAVLAPQLTVGLPPHITAATGIDAFTHSLEAYLAPGFHPFADGLALEGMRLCLAHLDTCCHNGDHLEARGCMQLASSLGATAFQKGLGMIHSLAHPLSVHHKTHHGLANALLLPDSIDFIEKSELDREQNDRLATVLRLFETAKKENGSLSASCRAWFRELGIRFGLRHHDIPESNLEFLADEAFEDPCHGTNIIPVTRTNLLEVYRNAF